MEHENLQGSQSSQPGVIGVSGVSGVSGHTLSHIKIPKTVIELVPTTRLFD